MRTILMLVMWLTTALAIHIAVGSVVILTGNLDWALDHHLSSVSYVVSMILAYVFVSRMQDKHAY